MSTHSFRAMNTDWWLQADLECDLEKGEAIVGAAEARLSRFREDSALSQLNRERHIEDAAVATVLRRALQIRQLTAGAFDPAIGQAVIAAGYTRSFEELTGQVVACGAALGTGPEVTIVGDRVTIAGDGLIDLGGIAKGWAVDQVAAWLEARGARSYVVDGGGDIRVSGVGDDGLPWALGVGEDHAVRLDAGALCTSSRRARRWSTLEGEAHHIIDTATRRPADSEIEEAAVIASNAATADALATALIAQPAQGLAAVERLNVAAMVRSPSRGWWMTPRMKEYLA